MKFSQAWFALLFAGLNWIIPHDCLTQTIAAAPPPIIKVQPEQLQSSLDQGDISGVVLQIEQAWRSQFENYFGDKLPSQDLGTDAIASSLGNLHRDTGKKAALLYLLPLPNQLEIILITPSTQPIHKRITAANRSALSEAVQAFRSEISDVRKRGATRYQKSAQQLYQWLIAPVAAELEAQGIDTLIFCAGSNLRTVPLAALSDGNQFLVEQYSLAVIPAFSLLDRRYVNLRQAQVLAMGASQFQTQTPLPAVPVELSTIAGNLWQGKSLLNQDFTLENLKAERRQQPFEIVHLATHADFQPGAVGESYIQFWDDRLRLNQLQTLGWRQIPVQLLVLSACTTALGDLQAELGFAGLAIQSGAKSAIASLWYVSDVGTLVLMTEFYKNLKTAPIKAEALRQSQIDMIRGKARLATSQQFALRSGNRLPDELQALGDRNLSHPFYWAAFTVIGSPW
jgi:CHAT domain-containing protein